MVLFLDCSLNIYVNKPVVRQENIDNDGNIYPKRDVKKPIYATGWLKGHIVTHHTGDKMPLMQAMA
ncbi:MAG: hypothetical protein B5M56_03895 [Desulfococcus sp. 4484_241]|nr:MAG: hypothetical protein B5M56_03895 [Desulfococcus sp. 4484_241]